MTTITELRRGRAASRTWLKRSIAKIEKLIDIECDEEVRSALTELDMRISTVDSFQEKIELVIDDIELEANVEEAAEVRDIAMEARLKAVRMLKKMSTCVGNSTESGDLPTGQSTTVSTPLSSGTAGQNARLPKLELPKFGGAILEWDSFWDQFQAGIDFSELPEVTKLVYLKSLLFGEAKHAIEGLPVVSANYKVACEILKERFARPARIIFAHVEKLLVLGTERQDMTLKAVQDSLLLHIRSLERLGVGGDKYGVILTPLVLSRLPESFRLEWARGSEGREGDLGYLLSCLRSEIDRIDRSITIDNGSKTKRDVRERGREQRTGHTTSSATALHSAANQDGRGGLETGGATAHAGKCGLCDGRHATAKCPDLNRASIDDRHGKIKAARLCFVCLKKGHVAANCRARCTICKGKHNVVCCFKKHGIPASVKTQVSPSNSEPCCDDVRENSETPEATLSCALTKQCTVLPTARVWVQGEKGSVQATLLFDSGSDRSYVTSSLAKRVGAKWLGEQNSSYAVFGGGKSVTCRRNLVQMTVSGANQSTVSMETISALEVPVICAPLQRPSVPSEALHIFRDLELADLHDPDKKLSIDILVGLDAYWRFMKDGIVRCPGSLVAQETSFGWVVSGAATCDQSQPASCQLLLMNDMSESALRNLWDLDVIGVKEDRDDEAKAMLDDFSSKVVYKDGRYEVALPWKSGMSPGQLQDNQAGAESRLSSLSRKLIRDQPLAHSYNEALGDMENGGIIEEVPANELKGPFPTYYMPHLPVVRPDSASTKVRPVFDASARGPNGVSLNDCLEAGPSLIPSLTDVLLRFRRHRYAVTGDITKAFLQVSVQPKDRDCLRFLWDVNGRKRVMRFCRVPFGVTSSPFLLNATIQHHLSLQPQSRTVVELEENLYVDDWLTEADSEADAREMFLEGSAVLSQAGMTLSKCHSNSEFVIDRNGAASDTDRLKILGVRWDPSEDVLKYDGVSVPTSIVPTKRVVLSFVARLFDPLGFLVPFVMTAKILFQRLWLKGLEWDDPIPSEEARIFLKWLDGISQLQELRIPRCYMQGGVCWSDMPDLEVHVFGDASQSAYGCVSYLRYRTPSGDFDVSFLLARARVAPVKTVTLPRLELLACLLAARTADHVCKALKLSSEVRVRCWTDSTIALAWIKSEPTKWKQFVRNRVVDIHTLTEPSAWSHTAGVDNPADAASRGLLADELVDSELWARGPEWLRSPLEQSAGCGLFVTSEELAETGKSAVAYESSDRPGVLRESLGESGSEQDAMMVSTDSDASESVLPLSHWSSLVTAVRVTAWVKRFIRNARNPDSRITAADLSYGEIREAKMTLIGQTQRSLYPVEYTSLARGQSVSKSSTIYKLGPFMSEDGLIRMKGRLQMAEMSADEKQPVILPKCHLSMLLVRFQHALMSHAGVNTMLTALRNSYWIVGARRIAKTVKRECVSCQRQDAQPCCEPAGPLPRLRVTESSPFSVTGIDFAGPLFSVDRPRHKLYVCLFTCATTRAVHLELTESMSLSCLLLALRRFVARRGWPVMIYSDNAKTFKACSTHLQSSMGHAAPEWRFSVPYAPWHGGWWERLIRSVKVGLRKSVGQRHLAQRELETILHEVEACVNSRPLTFVSDDSECPGPLIPNHFLIGHASVLSMERSEGIESASGEALGRLNSIRSERLERFWRVWRDEYVRNLPAIVPKFRTRGNVKLGSVVIIRRDNAPRLTWPMATVEKLYPGPDGVVRSVQVRTSDGRRTCCAVQRLHNLELV